MTENLFLSQLRNRIDRLDQKLIEMLSERARIAGQIAHHKKDREVKVYSPEREEDILKRISRRNPGPLEPEDLRSIFSEIISACRALQAPLKVVYLGPEGTFTHLAALKKFGKHVDLIGKDSVGEIFKEVEKKNADCGVVPIENSIEGAVTHTLDMFFESDLKICSEITLEVTHYLLGLAKKEKIKRIYSHPQVFGQCRVWLARHYPQAELIPASSTSRAAECTLKYKQEAACIGSAALSKLYHLDLISSHLEDASSNLTRFLIIAEEDSPSTGDDKTSLLFSIRDKVGALAELLAVFKKNRLNLTKIESRPSKKRPWEYYFFVDIRGHRASGNLKKALSALARKCVFLKVLGSYPAGSR